MTSHKAPLEQDLLLLLDVDAVVTPATKAPQQAGDAVR